LTPLVVENRKLVQCMHRGKGEGLRLQRIGRPAHISVVSKLAGARY